MVVMRGRVGWWRPPQGCCLAGGTQGQPAAGGEKNTQLVMLLPGAARGRGEVSAGGCGARGSRE